MALINLGMDFQAAKIETEENRTPLPPGIYELQIAGVTETDESGNALKTAKKGIPQFFITVNPINHPDPKVLKKSFRHYVTVMPGFVYDICKACGVSWSGLQFDPQSLLGKKFKANVEIGKGGWNNIASYV